MGPSASNFQPTDFPQVGVGVEFNMREGLAGTWSAQWISGGTELARAAYAQSKIIDYIQFQPTHFIFFPELFEFAKATPVLLHVSQLSLGSVGMELDEEYVLLLNRILRAASSPWLGEHISWSRFAGGDTRHFVLPFLDHDVAAT